MKLPSQIKQVVIWGLEPDSHTHAYIHAAFYKAFKHLGYNAFWFPDVAKNNFDFSNTLFITIDIADKHIPIRNDCYYILHNCTAAKYPKDRFLVIQTSVYGGLCDAVFHTDNPLIRGDKDCLYVHWMTDLLPHEIDENMAKLTKYKDRKKVARWIGSINSCPRFGNYNEIEPFMKECKANNIPFEGFGMYYNKTVKTNEATEFIKSALLAPAINGHWQRDNGYVPCRIFKNISYGHISGTNNQKVYELFDKKIPYDNDAGKLFYKMKESVESADSYEKTIELMKIVRDRFTYVNLIGYILKYAETKWN